MLINLTKETKADLCKKESLWNFYMKSQELDWIRDMYLGSYMDRLFHPDATAEDGAKMAEYVAKMFATCALSCNWKFQVLMSSQWGHRAFYAFAKKLKELAPLIARPIEVWIIAEIQDYCNPDYMVDYRFEKLEVYK